MEEESSENVHILLREKTTYVAAILNRKRDADGGPGGGGEKRGAQTRMGKHGPNHRKHGPKHKSRIETQNAIFSYYDVLGTLP